MIALGQIGVLCESLLLGLLVRRACARYGCKNERELCDYLEGERAA